MRKRFGVALGVAAAAVLALGTQSAAAATIKVTNTNDSGAGSLRAAINQANDLAGPDRIAITATGTISLGYSLPTPDTDLAIAGPGAGQLTIRRGLVGPGLGSPDTTAEHKVTTGARAKPTLTVPPNVAVTLNRISIVGGPSGIDNSGILTLSHSAVRDTRGYGIRNYGNAKVTDSVVARNRNGIDTYGTLTVLHSLVTNNTGRGIIGNAANFNVRESTLVRDSAVSGNLGGGISTGGDLTVSRSTLSGNSEADYGQTGYGGAIAALYPFGDVHVTVRLSTFSGNYARGGGGAIAIIDPSGDTGNVTVSRSTLSNNVVGAGGSGNNAIFNFSNTPITLRNTIVAKSGSHGADCAGVSSKGYNLVDDASCNLTAPGDQPNTEPLLGPLANYGGPTKTFALDPSSPAVDAGRADGAATDQRGFPRIVDYPDVFKVDGGDNSDIGAFELQAP